MLVDTKANVLPIYDSAEIHADAGGDWIIGDALKRGLVITPMP
jgi:aspartate racemase